MILDNFSDKLKIAYADILEAMLCQDTREEKDFDEQNRLTERRLYSDEKKLLFREIYDYQHNYVHKKLYPYSEEIVHLICPIYTEERQRALYLPIKERILNLGFHPEEITKITVRLKNYNEKGQKLQETYNWCKGFFAQKGSMGIDNIRYDERNNLYSSEGFNAYWNEKRNILRTVDLNGQTLIELSSWDENTFSTVEVYHYDDNKKLRQKIITNREGVCNILNYTPNPRKNKTKVIKIDPKDPTKSKKEGYTHTLKKGTLTQIAEHYNDNFETVKQLTTFNEYDKVVHRINTTYTDRHKKSSEKISRYIYNEQGVLTKEIHLSTDSFTELEILLYNTQGQKTERIYRRKNSNREVYTSEKTIYTYDTEGKLLLESTPTHLTHHFYTLTDDYDEHLEITVKTNL